MLLLVTHCLQIWITCGLNPLVLALGYLLGLLAELLTDTQAINPDQLNPNLWGWVVGARQLLDFKIYPGDFKGSQAG